MSTTDDTPDDDKQTPLVGATVLIGISYLGPEAHQDQMYGTVKAVSRKTIAVDLNGIRQGETFTLPPDTSAFRPAPKGEYRLKGTGEVVVDPDYLVTYEVYPPRAD